eukprot:2512124-Pyramimonas_sp.AAC.1
MIKATPAPAQATPKERVALINALPRSTCRHSFAVRAAIPQRNSELLTTRGLCEPGGGGSARAALQVSQGGPAITPNTLPVCTARRR